MHKSSIFLQTILVVGLLAVQGVCLIGIDTAPIVTLQNTFECLKSNGYQFSNVRAFTLEGIDLDLSVRDTLIYSQKAGLRTELFIRPCRGKSAKFQIDAVVLVIAEQYYERLWLYLEENPNQGCHWSNNYAQNCKFILDMLGQINYFQQKSGIYTSYDFYKKIMGNYQCDMSSVPLIYAEPDGAPTFENYKQIGSWVTPYGKMFQNNQYACGVNINKIYQKSPSNLVNQVE